MVALPGQTVAIGYYDLRENQPSSPDYVEATLYCNSWPATLHFPRHSPKCHSDLQATSTSRCRLRRWLRTAVVTLF